MIGFVSWELILMKLQPFKQLYCELVLKHNLRVHNMQINVLNLDNVLCECMDCGKSFFTTREGLKKWIKRPDFYHY